MRDPATNRITEQLIRDAAPPQPAPSGNQMIGMTCPDGSGVRIVRDAQARPMELRVTLANGQTQTLLSDAAYYPFGPVSRWTFGNGRVLCRSLNQNYQPGFVEDTASGGISVGQGAMGCFVSACRPSTKTRARARIFEKRPSLSELQNVMLQLLM